MNESWKCYHLFRAECLIRIYTCFYRYPISKRRNRYIHNGSSMDTGYREFQDRRKQIARSNPIKNEMCSVSPPVAQLLFRQPIFNRGGKSRCLLNRSSIPAGWRAPRRHRNKTLSSLFVLKVGCVYKEKFTIGQEVITGRRTKERWDGQER